jgi:hypothetical protein
MSFNDVEEGFIPSPTLVVLLSIIFNCALIGLNPEPSYETTPKMPR